MGVRETENRYPAASSLVGTYTKHGPGSMDHPMDLVHGPPHGPGPWITPWTTPNFVKEIVSVNVKIYQRSGYEIIAYVLEGLSRNSGLL